MLRTFITAFPWDLEPPDGPRFLDRAQGELGVQGINLWVAAPPTRQIRMDERGIRLRQSNGGLFFRPGDAKTFDRDRTAPIADWARTHDNLPALIESCGTRGLDVRLVVSLSECGQLCGLHPDWSCVNALDAPSRYAVCLSHDDVQRFWQRMAASLAEPWPTAALSVRGIRSAWTDHEREHWEMPGIGGTVGNALCSICFCESCCRIAAAAGVDVGAARRQVLGGIEQSANGVKRSAKATSGLAFFSEATALVEYLRANGQEMSAFVATLARNTQVPIIVHRGDSLLDRLALAYESLWCGGSALVTRWGRDEALEASRCQAAPCNESEWSAARLAEADEDGVVRWFQDAIRVGFGAIHLETLGMASEAQLRPLRQAIRFARRTSAAV